MMSYIKKLLKDNASHMWRATSNGFIIVSGLFIMRLSSFLVSILVARVAGAESLGQYTLFITVFILASEVPSAFDTAYLRATGMQNKLIHKALYERVNITAKLALLAVLGTLFYLLSGIISVTLKKQLAGEIIVWAVICGGLNSIFMLLPALAQQRRDYRRVAALKPTFNLAILILTVVVAAFGVKINIENLFKVYFAVGVVLASTALYLVYSTHITSQANYSHIRSYLSAAIILLTSASLTLIGSRLDVFFLGYYLNFEQLGVYGVALRISIVLSVLSAAMTTLMVPRAGEAAADHAKFKRYIALATFYSSAMIVCGVILLLIIKPLINIVFGDGYSSAYIPASILIIQVLIQSVGIPYQALIQCGNKPSRMIYISLFRISVSVPLLSYMVPKYGVTGAATAIAVTTLIIAATMMMLVIKQRPVTTLNNITTSGNN